MKAFQKVYFTLVTEELQSRRYRQGQEGPHMWLGEVTLRTSTLRVVFVQRKEGEFRRFGLTLGNGIYPIRRHSDTAAENLANPSRPAVSEARLDKWREVV